MTNSDTTTGSDGSHGISPQEIEAGDTIEVEVSNDAAIGGSTQISTLVVTATSINKITGEDPAWGDTCTITGFGTGTLEYADAGKSGEIEALRVMETTDDGTPIVGSGEVISA